MDKAQACPSAEERAFQNRYEIAVSQGAPAEFIGGRMI
jgi:hypothetical protein